MPSFSRRNFLTRLAALAAVQTTRRISQANAQGTIDINSFVKEDRLTVPVSVDWDHGIARIPENMLGLSYESSQLSAPDFFSAANTELIDLFRRLSPRGVLRLGGNLSEFTQWSPSAASAAVSVPFRAVTPDPSAGKAIAPIPVTPEAIRNLREFLDHTDWRAIYGLNLALASRERVVAEAKYVGQTLGDRLIAFQIGNEPNHYVLNRLRAAGYSFSDYFAEWSKIHGAVLEAMPTVRFAGPDIAEEVSWVEQFAAAAPESVILLTGHHYAEGPPTDPSMTIAKLLGPDPMLDGHIEAIEAVSQKARIPYLMAETNSCYNAGKPGVSDVFGSALWAADYILQLAHAKQEGVYFHGGGAGWYTPIAGGSGKPFEPRPIYFGLLLCRDLLGGTMVPANFTANSASVSVYAFQHPRRVVVINKDSHDIVVQFKPGESAVQALRLLAPSLDARTDITLSAQPLKHEERRAVRIPKHSAAILTMKTA
jgi:hypothetical protein